MKILQVFNQYRFRGGEEAWVDAIPTLLGDSAEVRELRFRSADWAAGDAPSYWHQAQLMGDNPASRAALRERVESDRPDLLLFHNVIPVGSFGLYEEAKLLGIPVIQYIHNFRPFSPGGTLWVGDRVDASALDGNPWPEIMAGGWQGSRVKTAILAWHLKRAMSRGLFDTISRWVAPSVFMRDKFVQAGLASQRVSVIPHCHAGGLIVSGDVEADYYLYLGRLEKDKGIGLLIDAWHEFAKSPDCGNIRLKIAGTGRLESAVREYAAADPSIEYLGFLEGKEKVKCLSECRGIVIPSICWESLGLTAYEAYSAGRPVIAARAGALQETVEGGVTGWTHDAGDVGGLVQALRDAESAGAAERARRGSAGRDWLRDNTSPDKWREDFLGLCESVVAESQHEKVRVQAADLHISGADGPEQRFGGNAVSVCQTPPHVCSVSVYLGDQNPGFGRSFGISRMSEVVLSALADRKDVALHVLVSSTSQQGPLQAASRRAMLWGTRNRFLRLLSDHLHPFYGKPVAASSCAYYPKGFLPLFDGSVRPTVVTIHDTIIDYYREHYPSWRRTFEYTYWCWMLKQTLRKADCILTVSECSKRQIVEFMKQNGLPPREITVTYEPCLYESIPQPVDPKKGDYMVHLASREPHKRTAHLVRWWLESEPAKRPTLHLVGNLPSEVAGFAEVSPYLVMRPYLDDAELRAEIMGAKALILPSEIEGFGLPALEAYYLGTPVCYSKETSVEEIMEVVTHKGGFDKDDPQSLFAAVDEVIAMSPTEIREHGLKLREIYAASIVAERMVAAFGRVNRAELS